MAALAGAKNDSFFVDRALQRIPDDGAGEGARCPDEEGTCPSRWSTGRRGSRHTHTHTARNSHVEAVDTARVLQ